MRPSYLKPSYLQAVLFKAEYPDVPVLFCSCLWLGLNTPESQLVKQTELCCGKASQTKTGVSNVTPESKARMVFKT